MKRRAVILATGIVILLCFLYLNSWGGSSCKDIPGLLLVKFKQGILNDLSVKKTTANSLTGIASVDQLNQRYNARAINKVFPGETSPLPGSGLLDLSGFYEIEFPEESDLQQLVSAYSQDPNLESAETVKMCEVDATPNDPNVQWHLNNALGNDADVDAYEAWDVGTGDSSVILAILDTGVLWFHPDLSGNIWSNSGEIADNGIDDDGNGYIDDVRGWDFVAGGYLCDVAGGEDCSSVDNDPKDFDGHGTHVAGIAAAVTNNSTGGAGLAGGWYSNTKGCKILPLRVGWHATDGLGYISMDYAAAAINYARVKGAKAINCSWGSSYNSALNTAVTNAINQGIVFCKSAGNDNTSYTDDYLINAFPQVLAIAATDRYDHKASFSNYGDWVDISAPGDEIRSTYAVNYSSAYAVLGGTSMAAPMVTGMVGLLRSKVPDLSISQVTSLIEDYSDDIDALNPTYAGQLGAGRISLYNSIIHLPNAKFSTDVNLGEVPLTVNFTDSSAGVGDGLSSWKWVFGDGDSAVFSYSPADTFHTYSTPGLHISAFSVTGTWGTNTQKKYIGVTADTVKASYSEGLALERGVKIPIYGNNFLPCSKLVIALRFGNGSAPLTCDSVRFWGTRVESFPIKNVSVHNGNQTILLTLQNSSYPLDPGNGLLANAYFTVDTPVVVGETLSIDSAIISSAYLDYTCILGDYAPRFQAGGIIIAEPKWGDANRDDKLSVSDVIFLINFLFKGGPQSNPTYIGDANCDGSVTVSDVVYLVSYLFKGGPPPGQGC
jgi:subtilisin family serine protease